MVVHTQDLSWRPSEHLKEVLPVMRTWRAVFWHLWGVMHVLYCFACGHHFCAAFYESCPASTRSPPCHQVKSHRLSCIDTSLNIKQDLQ
jgi:hypothetical protein